MLVQDKKTKEWYDPEKKWEELKKQQWFIDVFKRLSTK